MSSVILVVGLAKHSYQKDGYDIIGVDYGAYVCAKEHIVMEYAIADFDSCTPQQMDEISKYTKKVIQLPSAKDETDTEYATMFALRQGYDNIIIYGGLGGRLDHELANLALLTRRRYPLTLVDDHNELCLLEEGVHHLQKHHQYISFLPLEKSNVSFKQLVYPLDHKDLDVKDIFTISNEFESDQAIVEVHQGCLLCIQSSDLGSRL